MKRSLFFVIVLFIFLFSGCAILELLNSNTPPTAYIIAPFSAYPGDTITITCYASDDDNDELTYSWNTGENTQTITYVVPEIDTDSTLRVFTCTVSDGKDEITVSDTTIIYYYSKHIEIYLEDDDNIDVDMKLYYGDDTTYYDYIASAISSSNYDTLSTDLHRRGTYYLRVYSYSGSGSYTITFLGNSYSGTLYDEEVTWYTFTTDDLKAMNFLKKETGVHINYEK